MTITKEIKRFFNLMIGAFHAIFALMKGGWFVLRDASDEVVNDLAAVVPDDTCDQQIHELVRQAKLEQEARARRSKA